MAKHRKKSFKLLRALISLIVLAAVVLAAYVAVKCDGDLSWDNIERTVKNIRAGVKSADRFEYDASAGALFADLGGGLLKLDGTGVTQYSAGGDELYSEKLRFERPAMHAVNGRAAVYGVNGTEARVFDKAGLMYELKGQSAIISASMSSGGKLALCTREAGWSGSVTVYGIKGEAVYKWYCASGYPSVAAVSKDGSELAVLTLGYGGSSVVFLRLDSETEKARFELHDELALDIRWQTGGTLAVLTETELVSVKSNGEIAGAFGLEGKYLSAYSMESDDMTVLVASDYLGGSEEIMTVSASGQLIGSVSAENDVLSVSACGARAAVLYGDKAVIYKKDLTADVTLLMAEPKGSILMRSDGSALIVGECSAETLKP